MQPFTHFEYLSNPRCISKSHLTLNSYKDFENKEEGSYVVREISKLPKNLG
jgi:hypothetical protein